MYQSAFLVLLYGCTIKSSVTLKSFVELNVKLKNCKIVVWNNGPDPIDKKDISFFEGLGYIVEIIETLNNESLAVIYNQFILNNCAEKYIFLDDDSVLNENYLVASSDISKNEIGMPIIKFNREVQSPRIDGDVWSEESKINDDSKVLTIGSGLVVGADVIKIFTKKYIAPFDERFYLYGVDTTFCLRVFSSKMTNRIKIISGFDHSLSRLEKEDVRMSDFRRLERSYDRGLTFRYYKSFPCASYMMIRMIAGYIIRTLLKKKKTVFLKSVFKAYISGKHYRAK